jgi:CelD/BcsL family acetyltransferase involved in cellulose biosynthesis
MPLTVEGRPNPLAAVPACRPMLLQAFGAPVGTPWPACAATLLRKSVRTRLDRRWRRLADRGPVRFLAPQAPDEAEALFDRLVTLRRARFEALGRPEPLARPEVLGFYRALLREGLDRGTCRITGLQVGDEVIGAVYGLVRGGRYHMIIPAFADGDWRRCSPGLQVLRETMRWAAEAGLSYFDFTIGGEGYKGELGASPEPLVELIEPLSWRGLPLAAAMRGRRRLQRSERLRSVVARLRRGQSQGGRKAADDDE